MVQDGLCVAARTCLSVHPSSQLRVRVWAAFRVHMRLAVCARTRACMRVCFQALLGFGAGRRAYLRASGLCLSGEGLHWGCWLVFMCVLGGARLAQGSKSHCLVKPGTWSWKRELGLLRSQRNWGFPVWAQLRPDGQEGGREGGRAGQGDPLVLNHGCCRGDR